MSTTKKETTSNELVVESAPNGTTSSSSSSSLSVSSKNTNTQTEAIETNTTTSNNNTNNKSQSITNTTLRPFYSKLKKTHLFGVKLDKLMGAYNPQTNYKLPPQIIVI